MVFPGDKTLDNKILQEVIKNKSVFIPASKGSIIGEMPLGVRLILSMIFLFAAIIYTISPIDLIPEILGPIGFVDDILVWVITIAIDLNVLIGRGVKKGNLINGNLKKRNGFFEEDI